MFLGMVNQETGLRGYLATDHTIFLEPFTLGQSQYQLAMQQMKAQVQGRVFRRTLSALVQANEQAMIWSRTYSEPQLATMRAGKVTLARLEATRGIGTTLFDQFKNSMAHLQTVSEHDLSNLQARLDFENKCVLIITLIVSAIALGCAWFTFASFTRAFHQLTTLQAAVSQFGDGHFSVRVGDLVYDELNALGMTFNQMAEDLNTRDLQLEERRQEAQQRQDTFLIMVSHELKTPLTSMQLLIAFFERELTDAKYHKGIITIKNQLQRITRLVNDLLDMSRFKADQISFAFVPCDAIEIAREAIARAQINTSSHQLTLTGDTTAWVQADPDRLEQVIVNLLTNAIKYSPEADHIDIRISVNAHDVVFAVQDWGIGINKEAQAHVFKQYYRSIEATHYKYPGLGIGLYITSEIVKHHQGQIWVESEEGKGSTFSFSLPLLETNKENEI